MSNGRDNTTPDVGGKKSSSVGNKADQRRLTDHKMSKQRTTAEHEQNIRLLTFHPPVVRPRANQSAVLAMISQTYSGGEEYPLTNLTLDDQVPQAVCNGR